MKNDVSEVILNKGVRFAPTSPNISHRIQRYLPHRAKLCHAISKNLVM